MLQRKYIGRWRAGPSDAPYMPLVGLAHPVGGVLPVRVPHADKLARLSPLVAAQRAT